MAKRIFLSLFLCVFSLSILFSSTSFALTKEQEELKVRLDTLQEVLGSKRKDVYKKMKDPEVTDAGGFICTYEKGMTEICFQPKAEGSKAKSTDKAHIITAKMLETAPLTSDLVVEAIGGGFFPLNNQLYVQKEGCTFIISYDNSTSRCTQVQLAKV